MADDQHPQGDSHHSTVEEAAEAGPLPEETEQNDTQATNREDFAHREGVIPESDNDLDRERELDPEDRAQAIAGDETVGGIFQPGGHGG